VSTTSLTARIISMDRRPNNPSASLYKLKTRRKKKLKKSRASKNKKIKKISTTRNPPHLLAQCLAIQRPPLEKKEGKIKKISTTKKPTPSLRPVPRNTAPTPLGMPHTAAAAQGRIRNADPR
jgi:hypothetical protein